MVNSRVLRLTFVVALLAPLATERLAVAQEAANELTTDIYAGACGDDFGEPAASLTPPGLPEGETEGAADARPVATSFSTVPRSLEDLLAEDHVVATVGEDQQTAACGAIGGVRTEAGAIVIELSPQGNSGLSGVAYLAPSSAGPGQTDISLFLAGLEPAQPETAAEPTAAPTTEADQDTAEEDTTEPSARATDEVTVGITIFEFDPDPAVIAVGGTVTWVNEDPMAAHSVLVVSPDGVETQSEVLMPNGRYSQTFTEPGTYTVRDFINPMVDDGTIVVEPTGESTAEDTVDANQDASAQPTEEPAAEVSAATETYVSPSFGYSLSYDPSVWTVAEGPSTDADGIDHIALEAGFTTVHVTGVPGFFAGQAQTCVQILTDAQTTEVDAVSFEPLLDDAGVPIAGGGAEDAFGATRITRTTEGGGTLDQAFYARCIVLPAGGVLTIQQFAAELIYGGAAVDREQLLEGLTLP